MLTSANKARAKWVSDQAGLDEYFAEAMPEVKTAQVKVVRSRGVLVATTGDGMNDPPALIQTVRGSPLVETADVILVRGHPDVVAIVQPSCHL